jgi:hypothetical protein
MKKGTLNTIDYILSEHVYHKKIEGINTNCITQIIEMRAETRQSNGEIKEKPIAKLKIEMKFDGEDSTAKIFVFNNQWSELFEVPNPATAAIDFWIETKGKGGFLYQEINDEEELTDEQRELIAQDFIYLIEAAKDILIWN